ncbi:hypothetical protein BGZ73_006888 [Actinomortierella ambigua]|nr:hypothetical protein BGZ73_006888 [Actinomortierella ambigua]
MRSTSTTVLLLILLLLQTATLASAGRYLIKNRYLDSYAKVVQGAHPDERPIIADNNYHGLEYFWDVLNLDHGGQKDRHYELKNLHTKLAAAGDADKGSGSRVVAVPESTSSRWHLSPRFNSNNPTHSFVIFLEDTDLAWTLENGVVRLRPFEHKPTQLWAITALRFPTSDPRKVVNDATELDVDVLGTFYSVVLRCARADTSRPERSSHLNSLPWKMAYVIDTCFGAENRDKIVLHIDGEDAVQKAQTRDQRQAKVERTQAWVRKIITAKTEDVMGPWLRRSTMARLKRKTADSFRMDVALKRRLAKALEKLGSRAMWRYLQIPIC